MKHNNCYIYPKTVREAIDGQRHYDTGKEKLPSVTTILKATESEEKKESLAAWAARIGEEACLLYTSPSPRDGLLSRMPSSA